MTALSGNRMADWQGRLAGRLREGGLFNSLVGLFQNSTDNQSEGPLGEWRGIKHMVRIKNDSEVTVKIVCDCYYPRTFAGLMHYFKLG